MPSNRGQFRGSPDYDDPQGEGGAPKTSSDANSRDQEVRGDPAEDEEDDDDYGPGLPTRYGVSLSGQQHSGPSIPTMQDLDLRNGLSSLPRC